MFILLTGFLAAQNEVDALRYSQNFLQGTARSSSMGGAFGALGGDFSAVSINPAGIAVFRKSELVLTPGFSYNVSKATLGDNSYEDFDYDFNFNNIGIVGTFNTGAKSGWISTNIGFGYNRINTFNMNTAMKHDEATTSIVDEWLNDANLYGYDNMPTASYLAYQTDLIYEEIDGSDIWLNDFTGVNYMQRQSTSLTTTGSVGEYIFSGGANYNNMVYLGGSFSINSVNYNEKRIHKENDLNDEIEYFNSLVYTKSLETRGAGYSFKFGAIVKPVQWIRLGGAIHFPTFYNLQDKYSDKLDVSLTFNNESPVQEGGEFDYELISPFKAIASAAFVLDKFALLSFDYEFIDYTTARLRNGGERGAFYDFEYENENIQTVYTAAHNLRGGLELRFGPMSLRGGYAYYASPYKSGQLNEDTDYSVMSGGFGINNNDFYIDFAYSHRINSEYYVLYQVPQKVANLDYARNQAMITLGFRF